MIRWDTLELDGGRLEAFAAQGSSVLFFGAPRGFHGILAGRSARENLYLHSSTPSAAAKGGDLVCASFDGRPLHWSIDDVIRDSSKWFRTRLRDPDEVIERFALGPVAKQRWDRVPGHIAKLVAIAAAYATGARTLLMDDLAMALGTEEERGLFDWMTETLRSGLREVSWISFSQNDATPLAPLAEECVSLYGGHPVVVPRGSSAGNRASGAGLERVLHVWVEGVRDNMTVTSAWSGALAALGIRAHWSNERNAWIEMGPHPVRVLYETLPPGLLIREVIPLAYRGVKEGER